MFGTEKHELDSSSIPTVRVPVSLIERRLCVEVTSSYYERVLLHFHSERLGSYPTEV